MDHHRRVRGRTFASDPRPCEVEGSAGPSVEHMKVAEHRQKMVESLQEDASFCEASFGAYCSSDAHADAFLIDVFCLSAVDVSFLLLVLASCFCSLSFSLANFLGHASPLPSYFASSLQHHFSIHGEDERAD